METQKYIESFLMHDYDQCFQQMRYYDNQIFSITKFMSTIYTSLIALGVGLYKYGISIKSDWSSWVSICLIVAIAFGIFMLMLAVRNRVYFVHVTRYINEIRGGFLNSDKSTFKNICGMYTNPSQPPFFNWLSSQSFFLYLIALINSGLVCAVVYVNELCLAGSIILGTVGLVLQLSISIIYLQKREGKSAAKSVFGKE